MKSLLIVLCLLAVANGLVAQPPAHPANPQVLSIVQQISSDSIFANITRLVQCQTRHTFSDTTSDSTGVGAAMRWVLAKGEGYDSGGRFDWEEFPWAGYFNGNPVTRNVLIVRVAGVPNDSARYFIGGHLDSRNANLNDNLGFAPGADDDGSSCAAFLEMLRLLPDSLTHNLEVMWFTGEEQGLLGSAAYAQHLAQVNARVDGMLGLDMIGHILANGQVDSTSMRLFAQGPSESSSRSLQRYFKWVGETYAGVDSFVISVIPATDRPGRGGDHMSFSGHGYPAIRVMETNEDVAYQHGPNDIPQNLSPTYARRIAMCTYGTLLTLLLAPARPVAPQVENSNGVLEITIPDSVTLPPGGHFYLSMRRSPDSYFRWITDLDTSRNFAYVPDTAGVTYAFAVSVADSEDRPSPFSPEVTIQILAVHQPTSPLPKDSRLEASPNPFNNAITFSWSVSRRGRVRLDVYDILGQRVASVMDEELNPGAYRRQWSPSDRAGGVFFVRLVTPAKTQALKILYVK